MLKHEKPFVVEAEKWEEFLKHKTDEQVLERCKIIDAMIPDSAKVKDRRDDDESISSVRRKPGCNYRAEETRPRSLFV